MLVDFILFKSLPSGVQLSDHLYVKHNSPPESISPPSNPLGVANILQSIVSELKNLSDSNLKMPSWFFKELMCIALEKIGCTQSINQHNVLKTTFNSLSLRRYLKLSTKNGTKHFCLILKNNLVIVYVFSGTLSININLPLESLILSLTIM